MKSSLDKKRKILLIIIIILLILSLFIIFDPFHLFTKKDNDKIYRIKNDDTDKYLEITGDNLDDDAPVDLNDKSTDLDQAFTIDDSNDSNYKVIINVNSMKALEVNDNNTDKDDDKKNNSDLNQDKNKDEQDNDSSLNQDTYKEEKNQQFELIKNNGGFYYIKNKESGKYLTVEGDKVVEKDLIDPPDKSQKWYLEELTNPYNTIKEYMRYKYVNEGDKDRERIKEGAKALGFEYSDEKLDEILNEVIEDTKPKTDKLYKIRCNDSNSYWKIENNSLNNNARLNIASKEETMGQLFRFVPSSIDGYYNIVSCNSNLVLDCFKKRTNNNVNIVQNSRDNLESQMFKVEIDKGGLYKIQLKHSGLFCTIQNKSNNIGKRVFQRTYTNKASYKQNWYLEEIDTSIKDIDSFVKFCVIHGKTIDIDRIYTSCLAVGLNPDKDELNKKVDNAIKDQGTNVFTNTTGFITTYDMLNKTVNEISFAGAHNAYANNKDRRSPNAQDTYKTDFNTGTENHDVSIKTMLDVGYRVIDLDIGNNGRGRTGCYNRNRLNGYTNLNGKNGILPKIKKFVDNNPNEIVIINISDVFNGTTDLSNIENTIYNKDEANYNRMFRNLTKDMKRAGLLQMTYNFNGDINSRDLYSQIKIPGKDIKWPTLKQMIQNNKRVLLLERNTNTSVNVPFKNQSDDPIDITKENLDLNDDFINGLKNNNITKIINVAYTQNFGASAGNKNAAKINNDGKKIYEINSQVDSKLNSNGINNVVNVVYVDYATGNTKQGGPQEVSPVDAVNKENFNHFDNNWNKDTVGDWYW